MLPHLRWSTDLLGQHFSRFDASDLLFEHQDPSMDRGDLAVSHQHASQVRATTAHRTTQRRGHSRYDLPMVIPRQSRSCCHRRLAWHHARGR